MFYLEHINEDIWLEQSGESALKDSDKLNEGRGGHSKASRSARWCQDTAWHLILSERRLLPSYQMCKTEWERQHVRSDLRYTLKGIYHFYHQSLPVWEATNDCVKSFPALVNTTHMLMGWPLFYTFVLTVHCSCCCWVRSALTGSGLTSLLHPHTSPTLLAITHIHISFSIISTVCLYKEQRLISNGSATDKCCVFVLTCLYTHKGKH